MINHNLLASILVLVVSISHIQAQAIRCGSTWESANAVCGQACETVDSQCPDGQHCFAGVNPLACGPLPVPSSRCGAFFDDADAKCGTQCTRDNDCSNGETCFSMLNVDICSGVVPVLPNVFTTGSGSGSSGSGSLTTIVASEPGNSNVSNDPNATVSQVSNDPTGNQFVTNSQQVSTSTAVDASSTKSTASATTIATAPNGLPLLPTCATGCFTAANLFNLPTSNLLQNFCSNETNVANTAYACSLNSCTTSAQQSQTVQYLNALGAQCTSNNQGNPGWTFTPQSSQNQGSDGASSSGLSGLWIGLIVLFVVLFLAIVGAVVYLCCFRGRRRKHDVDTDSNERRDHYNHIHA
ncbi:UNVERIFIED_CONTAM: hypothetical protein HDU68_011319 [Siphonaria sp. JEL0065]|nr:hypothetical protein HDU68_011319 [Siphonaria sp. JEL0065]